MAISNSINTNLGALVALRSLNMTNVAICCWLTLVKTSATAKPDQIIPLIDQALSTLTSLNADLGIRQKLIDDANERLQLQISLSKEFVAGIKDVDMAEVFTKVSQQQIALEASFQVTAQMANLSLVDFLR